MALLGVVAVPVGAAVRRGQRASGAATRPAAHPTAATRRSPRRIPFYNPFNSGMANSSIQIFNKAGQLVDLWQHLGALLRCPSRSSTALDAAFFTLGEEPLRSRTARRATASRRTACRRPGTPGGGGFPDLQHLGPATFDFWIESGRMPATATNSPSRSAACAARPPPGARDRDVPQHAPARDALHPAASTCRARTSPTAPRCSRSNCAACHTITGDGDALANDTFAPSLRNIPAIQVAEALRTGPANMPIFTGNLTDAQLRDVVAYVVEKIQHPQNPGGLGLGGLGPVGEGFIGLALGVGLLALVGFWIGDRS